MSEPNEEFARFHSAIWAAYIRAPDEMQASMHLTPDEMRAGCSFVRAIDGTAYYFPPVSFVQRLVASQSEGVA